jgi:hypothetical protein
LLANVLLSLPAGLGKAKASKSFGELFAKSRAINLLAAAEISRSNRIGITRLLLLPAAPYGEFPCRGNA